MLGNWILTTRQFSPSQSVLLVKETGIMEENHRSVADKLYYIILYLVPLATREGVVLSW
jgi:hypothetical protein